MIRALRAMGWLRWRLLLNTLRGGRRRDAMERVSRAMALMVPFIMAALFVGSTAVMTVAGFLGGQAVADASIYPPTIILIARGAISVLCVVVIMLAAGAPGQTTLSRYTRLLVMPIPRQALHLVEVVSNLADPWQVLLAAGLVAFSAGMLVGGEPLAAAIALLAGALVMGVLASLSAAFSFLVAWLFRSRRRGELFTLIFVMALSGLSLIPAFLSKSFDSTPREGRPEEVNRPFSVDEFNASLPAWSRVLPSEAYGLTINQAVAGRPAGIAAGLLLLVGQVGLLFLASSAVHSRVIQSLEGDGRRRKQKEIAASAPRLPFVGAAASAVAWAQYRTAIRSVRGRLIVLFPGPLLALMMVIFRQLPGDEGRWAASAAGQGYLLLGAGVIFGFYSMQAFTMNMFGSDRSGLTLQLLAPVSDRHLAWGKVYGCWLVLCAGLVVTFAASVAVAPSGSPYYWLAVFVAAFAMYMSLSPITVWLSALFPQASDLSKTGSGGNPHPLPMFVGTFLVMLAALPNALIILIVDVWWKQQPILSLAGVTIWAIVISAIAIPLVNLSSRAVGARRENLALVAQGK
jgi:hypothetical protein